jgi:hypothetical protein
MSIEEINDAELVCQFFNGETAFPRVARFPKYLRALS